MTGSKPEHGLSGAESCECPGNPGQRSVDAHRGPSLPHRSWSGGSTPLPNPEGPGWEPAVWKVRRAECGLQKQSQLWSRGSRPCVGPERPVTCDEAGARQRWGGPDRRGQLG